MTTTHAVTHTTHLGLGIWTRIHIDLDSHRHHTHHRVRKQFSWIYSFVFTLISLQAVAFTLRTIALFTQVKVRKIMAVSNAGYCISQEFAKHPKHCESQKSISFDQAMVLESAVLAPIHCNLKRMSATRVQIAGRHITYSMSSVIVCCSSKSMLIV